MISAGIIMEETNHAFPSIKLPMKELVGFYKEKAPLIKKRLD
jgi:hypothetical protein